jgi:hypothetical protein
MHQLPKFSPVWNSTCFGNFLCTSSGAYSLYTRHWYMSYRFEDSFRAGPGWNWFYSGYSHQQQNKTSSILVLLESCPQTYMTCTRAEFTVNKLLMMTRGNSRKCRVSCRCKFGKLVHLVGFIIKKLQIYVDSNAMYLLFYLLTQDYSATECRHFTDRLKLF